MNDADVRLVRERLSVATLLEEVLYDPSARDHIRGSVPNGTDPVSSMHAHRVVLEANWNRIQELAAARVANGVFADFGMANPPRDVGRPAFDVRPGPGAKRLFGRRQGAENARPEFAVETHKRVITAREGLAPHPTPAADNPRPFGPTNEEGLAWANTQVKALVNREGLPPLVSDPQWAAYNYAAQHDGKVMAARVRHHVHQFLVDEGGFNSDQATATRTEGGNGSSNRLAAEYRLFAAREEQGNAAAHRAAYARMFFDPDQPSATLAAHGLGSTILLIPDSVGPTPSGQPNATPQSAHTRGRDGNGLEHQRGY
jgi:hypothetical protein